jgi:MFS family permease
MDASARRRGFFARMSTIGVFVVAAALAALIGFLVRLLVTYDGGPLPLAVVGAGVTGVFMGAAATAAMRMSGRLSHEPDPVPRDDPAWHHRGGTVALAVGIPVFGGLALAALIAGYLSYLVFYAVVLAVVVALAVRELRRAARMRETA